MRSSAHSFPPLNAARVRQMFAMVTGVDSWLERYPVSGRLDRLP